jgi:hypothetical protein
MNNDTTNEHFDGYSAKLQTSDSNSSRLLHEHPRELLRRSVSTTQCAWFFQESSFKRVTRILDSNHFSQYLSPASARQLKPSRHWCFHRARELGAWFRLFVLCSLVDPDLVRIPRSGGYLHSATAGSGLKLSVRSAVHRRSTTNRYALSPRSLPSSC